MRKICFTSVCTADSYSYYIPLFVYTVKRAYPDAGVKIFVKGSLNETVKKALELIPYDGWDVKENCFKEYPSKQSITNSLRFLSSSKNYNGYDYVFVRDIDFLIFYHKTTHERFFVKRMKKLPYFGVRGPYRKPRRAYVNRGGWKGSFTRVAGGTFVFKNPQWFDRTKKMIAHYRHNLKRNIPDNDDNNMPASYREYDEVMLFRIIKGSGMPAPSKKGKSVYGYTVPKRYRDVHLGDFNKEKHGYRRLVKRVAVENLKNFVKMEKKDVTWRKIRFMMSGKNSKIRECLRRLRKHARRRLASSCLSEEETAAKQ